MEWRSGALGSCWTSGLISVGIRLVISVGIRFEGGGVDDSLVVHQLVTLVVWEGEELVGFGVSDDLVSFDDLGLARLVLRVLDFVEHVLAHDVIVELGFALAVEPEASHLALDFPVLGLVPVILGTSRDKFGDVIVRVQFAGELPEVVSQKRVGLSGFLEIDDGVGIKVEHPLTEEFEGFVETESRPTGGEAGHENVEVGRDGDVFLLELIVDFDQVVVDDGDVFDIVGVRVEEIVEGFGVLKIFDLGFVETLAELAPHGIEHHFGQGSQPGIALDLEVIQENALVLKVIVDVLVTFGVVVSHPLGPAAGFLFDFQPGVDIIFEESFLGFEEMPHFVDVLDLVAQLEGFVQLGGAPGTGQNSLVFRVCAEVGSLQRGFGHFFFHTGSAEWKGEFAFMAVRQHGMVEFARRQHLALDDSKVAADVGVTGLRDEDGMAFGVEARFVDPRVQRGVIDVVDLLVGGHTMMQLDGIGTTSAKGVPWVERWGEAEGVHVGLDVRVGLEEPVPLAFPHFDDLVPFLAKEGHFGLGLFVDVLYGAVEETQMSFLAFGITGRTAMPETPVKFVYGPGLGMKTVHGEGGARNVKLACVAYVLDVGTGDGKRLVEGQMRLSLLTKLVIAPGQPFEGHLGLVDAVAPSADGFTG